MKGNEPIAAVATPKGIGAIGVVRVSGPDALRIAHRILKNPLNRPNLIQRNEIVEGGRTVDVVMAVFFQSPHSYTGEDMVEIYCHGGRYLPDRILTLLIKNGARLARPGEFTMRAVLNNKLDLIQAEAVLDLVEAKSDRIARIAIENLTGRFSHQLQELARRITKTLIQVEGNLDFPEDEEWLDIESIRSEIGRIHQEVNSLLEGGREGIRVREGPLVVISGRRNVGKSTLFNQLLGTDRAIVTPTPGTTRDYLIEELKLGPDFIRLVDTAGIGMAQEEIEAEGMRRATQLLDEADLILLVIDRSQPLTPEDSAHLSRTEKKRRIIILNKSDLQRKVDMDGDIEISALTGEGIAELKRMISKYLFELPPGPILRRRQLDLLTEVERYLASAQKGGYLETIASDLRGALDALGELTGKVTSQDILNQIFAQFCIGK
ncbi:tRNA uridine-5-carboxymethylaminomethyl(34) synthesis GTPase MnmE [candidate division WOR-3 bacterium]|uniref:tRNA modification GTPase MnmE n=1 Tax=candidate division WOR-3 bacterium TaxID=2052148 RepID=A0A660SH92_UNCW3|nr:MAG: tRNA uridine-5-carboxymethylaminomethyl(34) synthesis GTPase MnmE [candidate division WOR-3 bacterium]